MCHLLTSLNPLGAATNRAQRLGVPLALGLSQAPNYRLFRDTSHTLDKKY